MRVLVVGASGMCGRRIVVRGAARGYTMIGPPRHELDVRDPTQALARIAASEPDLVINAAALTHVDDAETLHDAAFAVNAAGAGHLASACAVLGIPMLQLSTDYVFDGTADRPYREDDPTGAIGEYGASKEAGERLVLCAGGTVVRTSWLFAPNGHGFVQRILAGLSGAQPIKVVTDRHGRPTWADDLADALLDLKALGVRGGILHYAGDGATSRYGFACAIAEAAGIDPARVIATISADYPTLAARPGATVLDTTKIAALGIVPRAWTHGLALTVAEELGR